MPRRGVGGAPACRDRRAARGYSKPERSHAAWGLLFLQELRAGRPRARWPVRPALPPQLRPRRARLFAEAELLILSCKPLRAVFSNRRRGSIPAVCSRGARSARAPAGHRVALTCSFKPSYKLEAISLVEGGVGVAVWASRAAPRPLGCRDLCRQIGHVYSCPSQKSARLSRSRSRAREYCRARGRFVSRASAAGSTPSMSLFKRVLNC